MQKRVAVNLLWCVPGVGGSEEYLVRQLRGTTENNHNFRIDIFAPKGFRDRHRELAEMFTIVEAPSTCRQRWIRIFFEHTWLAWRTRTYDIVHHGGGTVPKWGNTNTVMTLHDLQWTTYPEYVAPIKRVYLRRVVPSSLKRAKHIAVPTQYVASTIEENFGESHEKISVVRHGVESDVLVDKTSEDELRRRWSLEGATVLVFPAITHPHKNHLFLLSLMSGDFPLWRDSMLKIVFAGSPGSAEQKVRAFIEAHQLTDRVVMPGRISSRDRNGLIACADAMVFPSQYEGFGAPLIEAMHIGTPLIASDRTCIPEVVGDAGIIAPLEPEAWVDALEKVREMRVDLVERGKRRAQNFTTALSGADLLTVYRRAIREQ